MTKNAKLQQQEKEVQVKKQQGTLDINFERQVWQLEDLKKKFPKHVYIFDNKEEFFKTWANNYHGSHFHSLFHINSTENKYVTRPTLKLVPQFWGATAEILKEMVESDYLGEEYRVVDETQKKHEYANIPVYYENVCKEEAAVIQHLIASMVKLGVTTGIELLVLKEKNKMLFVFTTRFLNDDFVLKNAYSDKQTVAEDYVQTLKEIEELKRKKELYEEWLELK